MGVWHWLYLNRLLLVWTVPFIAIPPFVGWLTGWFVGASQSPVVSSLLPLLFGIGTALSYMLSDRHAMIHRLTEELYDIDEVKSLPPPAQLRLANVLGVAHLPLWIPLLWTASAIVFCTFVYCGTRAGIAERVETYPTLHALIGSLDSLTPEERSLLTEIRLRCISANLSSDETQQYFADVITPVLADSNRVQDEAAVSEFASAKTAPLIAHREVVARVIPEERRDDPLSEQDIVRILSAVTSESITSLRTNVRAPGGVFGQFPTDLPGAAKRLGEDKRTANHWLKALDLEITKINTATGTFTKLQARARLQRLREVVLFRDLKDTATSKIIRSAAVPVSFDFRDEGS